MQGSEPCSPHRKNRLTIYIADFFVSRKFRGYPMKATVSRTGHVRGMLFHIMSVAAALMLLLLAMPAFAQPNLNFKRVTVNWPTVELYFSVGCNGSPAYTMTKSDFRIEEDGVAVPDFTLWCPAPNTTYPISATLVFDASGSMMGSGNAGAKAGGRAFVDKMDGQVDEASVIWFTSQVNTQQQMTTLKPLLYSAIDALPASGATAVWDGTYAGVIELVNNGINQCRAVIVMTDGGDNSSMHTPAEIISLAQRNQITVFTIGLGSSINATELEMIALLTGGRYYQTPNAGQLGAIYQDIYTIISQCNQECRITYERDCADGSLRTVELALENFCGGTDIKTKTYRAPLDSTTFTTVGMKLGKTVTLPGQQVTLSLDMTSSLAGETLPRFSFLVPVDSSCSTLQGVALPPGSLLDGVPLTVTPVAGGLRVQTQAEKQLSGSGTMMELTFLTAQVQDTTCCDITLEDFQFESGCFLPDVEAGEICVVPGTSIPVIMCRMDAPAMLEWDVPSQSFVPDPFDVTMHIRNNGTVSAVNTRFRVFYDTALVSLVNPTSDTQPGNPVDLAPAQESSVTWSFHAKKQDVNYEAAIVIEAYFDNHDTVTCSASIPFGPILTCNLTIPAIRYEVGGDQYTPMPFPVEVAVKNTGGLGAERPVATITFDPDLQLTPGYPLSIPIRPDQLDPQETGTVRWNMQHVKIDTARTYTVRVSVTSPTADSILCEEMVRIPPAKPGFHFPITASGPLRICAGAEVILDAGSGYVSYWWNTGEQTQRITVGTAGDYYCLVTDSSRAQGVSDTVTVTIAPLPKPVLTAVGTIPMCEGDSVVLEAPSGYVSYSWNSGSATRIEVARTAGEYWCTVVDTNGCAGTSDTIVVTTYPAPATPTVTRNGDILLASMAPSWQWYRDGAPMAGETNQFLALSEIGTYTVLVTDSNGCSAMSDPIEVTVLGMDDLPAMVRSFDVYPNPSNGRFTLALTLAAPASTSVTVTDLLGREILSAQYPPSTSLHETFRLRDVASGRYMLRVRLGGGEMLSRVIAVGFGSEK